MIQNSYGHCSTSTPSKCTARLRKKYYQTGELPKNGTICEGDVAPWDETSEAAHERNSYRSGGVTESKCKDSDEDMQWAMKKLGEWNLGSGLLSGI